MVEAIFLITAIIALSCSLITVTSHHIVHALLFMVIMMLAIALIFFLLGAPFAAALQLIVYAGAIMVLFIFVTMMLHQGDTSLTQERQLFGISGSWLSLAFALTLLAEVITITLSSPPSTALSVNTGNTNEIGILLFGPYHQLIILTALLLLSALISAIHIAKTHKVQQNATNSSLDNEEQA